MSVSESVCVCVCVKRESGKEKESDSNSCTHFSFEKVTFDNSVWPQNCTFNFFLKVTILPRALCV